MSKRGIQVLVLVLIFLAVGWRLWDKRDVLRSNLADVGLFSSAASNEAQAARSPASDQQNDASQAGGDDFDIDDESKPPRAKPAPEFEPGLPDEMLPFAADTPVLDAPTSIPAKRLPLVYMAYGQDASSDKNTSASIWFGEFLKFQVRAQPGESTLLNLVPNRNILITLTRAFTPRPTEASYEAYLHDAKVNGADILVVPVADDNTSSPRVRVKMVDLRDDRTLEWQPEDPGAASISDSIVDAAVAIMKFAGLDDATIEASGVRDGAPKQATFARMAFTKPNDMTYEVMQSLIEKDPDCRNLYNYEAGTTSRLQLINEGLGRFPDDARLQIAKAFFLAANESPASLVRYTSELMRRYPDNVYVYVSLPEHMHGVFEPSMPPREAPDVYAAMIKQMDAFSETYPEYCGLHWTRAYMHQSLGSYARGWRTVNRIPAEQWDVYRAETRAAYDIMTKLVEKHPELPALQTAYSYFLTEGGDASNRRLREHMDVVARLDPRAVDAEVQAAAANSVGYGRGINYIRMIDAALKRHEGDPQAIRVLTKAVGRELQRQESWKMMTEHETYGTSNSYLVRFVTGAEFVYSRGMNLGITNDRLYYHIAELNRNDALIGEWHKTGQNSLAALREAKLAHDSGNWERGLQMAELALPAMEGGDDEHICRYYVIKCLWKLKRYDESMKASREGIMKYPHEQSFPYMYAVVALEADRNLESAFDCAWRAVDISTSNPGCNETFEKLRAKLNKPQHPALAQAGM